MHGATDVDYLYGFPPLPGDRSLKVATEQYETSTTADTVDRTVDPVESAKMYRDHVKGRLAGATPRVARTAACLYTVTPIGASSSTGIPTRIESLSSRRAPVMASSTQPASKRRG